MLSYLFYYISCCVIWFDFYGFCFIGVRRKNKFPDVLSFNIFMNVFSDLKANLFILKNLSLAVRRFLNGRYLELIAKVVLVGNEIICE